jgi:hypothetical protein
MIRITTVRRHRIRMPTGLMPTGLLAVLLAGSLALAAPPARAAGDRSTGPAPRAAVEMAGLSVVLITANGKLHAFVDRQSDNAPAEDATLTVATAEGSAIRLRQTTAGLFVAPFDPGQRQRDTFLIGVTSALGTADAIAEITYRPPGAAVTPPADETLRDRLLIAVLAGGIGLVLGSMAVRRRSQRQQQWRPI